MPKKKKEEESPSLISILVGGVFAALIGVSMAVVDLATTPVVVTKEMPAEADRVEGQVYLVTGTDTNAGSWRAKWDRFAAGSAGAYNLTAGELTAWSAANLRPAVIAGLDDEGDELFGLKPEVSPPSFRVENNEMQVSTFFEFPRFPGRSIPVQATGTFANESGRWVFKPNQMHVGSCPIPGIPGLKQIVIGFLAEDFTTSERYASITNSWTKVENASVADGTLTLALR